MLFVVLPLDSCLFLYKGNQFFANHNNMMFNYPVTVLFIPLQR